MTTEAVKKYGKKLNPPNDLMVDLEKIVRGGAWQSRTADLINANDALYQLS